jgi:hypothetical protein
MGLNIPCPQFANDMHTCMAETLLLPALLAFR